jgi:capsule polysaccharide export protein KpsE/RkpR
MKDSRIKKIIFMLICLILIYFGIYNAPFMVSYTDINPTISGSSFGALLSLLLFFNPFFK